MTKATWYLVIERSCDRVVSRHRTRGAAADMVYWLSRHGSSGYDIEVESRRRARRDAVWDAAHRP